MEAVCEPATEQMPQEVDGLRGALLRQREYTLALYADLPDKYWSPADFPYSPIVNPPLWELAHIAWFAEFFCLRWRPDDLQGQRGLARGFWSVNFDHTAARQAAHAQGNVQPQ